MGSEIWFPLQADGEVKILTWAQHIFHSSPPEKQENEGEKVNDPDIK